jgi:hypothetical protein
MQLVLGTRHGAGLGTPGAPLPAPPERWRLGERARRNLRRAAWIAAFTALATLGALHGATIAIGAEGVSELAGEPGAPTPEASAAREPGGGFWRPAGSHAERPAAEIVPRRWEPTRGE